ncbi:lamin tail domain-containing protein [Candidatus Pacearchaeota archaeon]|nr:lamin tail domain-containing protein [Candidatus Pacearchaeota archaeon]
MKKIIPLALALLVALPLVLAGVSINEIELNPSGSPDSGHQWIEIYNSASQDLSGWYILDRDGDHFNLSGSASFYVLDSLTGLRTSNENLSLFNNIGTLVDYTNFITDSSNNGKTWQRVPDGTGSFVFEDGTKGITNLPTIIENETADKACVVESENVTLIAQVSGFCIQNVIFSIDLGSWMNFTATRIGDNYTYIIPSDVLEAGNVHWKVYSLDCFNRTMEGSQQTLNVKSGSSLSVNPSLPNGLNGWYVNEPTFTIDKGDADHVWYQWDSDDNHSYTGPFGLENIPNAVEGVFDSAGFLTLKWFSDVCASELGRNELKQQKNFMVDLTSPIIKNQMPAPNSIVHLNDFNISAYIDEKYNGNSGVNLSSIVMRVDGVVVPAVSELQDNIDAAVNYIAHLDLGVHNVSLEVKDNAGRSSHSEWSFSVDIAPEFFLNVHSPENSIYEKKRVLFNLSINDGNGSLVNVDKIDYIDYNDLRPRWTTLCTNCDSYERLRNIDEGQNNITIRVQLQDVVKNVNISSFVDSKKPIISSMLPKKNGVTNGSNFWLKYSEDNLEEVKLLINHTDNSSSFQDEFNLNCTSGKNKQCSKSLDLSEFDGSWIEYWFEVSDSINTVITKRVNVSVDTTSPILIINMPENGTYGKNVPFNLSVNEKTDIEYLDSWDEVPAWKKICGNCNGYGLTSTKTKLFKKGIHNLMIKATDKAGNSDEGSVGFLVDY